MPSWVSVMSSMLGGHKGLPPSVQVFPSTTLSQKDCRVDADVVISSQLIMPKGHPIPSQHEHPEKVVRSHAPASQVTIECSNNAPSHEPRPQLIVDLSNDAHSHDPSYSSMHSTILQSSKYALKQLSTQRTVELINIIMFSVREYPGPLQELSAQKTIESEKTLLSQKQLEKSSQITNELSNLSMFSALS